MFLMLGTTPASFVSAVTATSTATSTAADELKLKIEDRNNQIKQLEYEISQYNNEVQKISGEATTLQKTLQTLDLTQKKITTDITLTDRKISKTTLTITQTQNEIVDIQNSVAQNKKAIYSLIQNIRMIEDNNIVAQFLFSKNLGDIWTDVDTMNQVQNQIKIKSDQLRLLQASLENKKNQLGTQKKNLSSLKQDLSGKKQAVEVTKQEKATILAQTKNKEQVYKEIVKTKEEQKAQFEKELYDFESQLNLVVDKSKYPSARIGLFAWPLDNAYITQRFGVTVDSKRLYLSGSHNGIDFRATVGTRVKSIGSGIVVGTGNTDIYPGCYSFGKWVMIDHQNGLSSIYGHLSVISVSKGQELQAGDLIGYSGNTGYTTGPHLHLGIYATQGVRIEQFVNSRGCKQAIIPLADTKAYLDPMAYMPAY
ncbi:MAG: peptidoglycan DD-metalloendopeptidase family protein [bacterium]